MRLCKECKGEIFYDKHESYCKNCGLVVDDAAINFGRESFELDPEKAARVRRTGAPVTWLNPDFSTTFNPKEARKIFRR